MKKISVACYYIEHCKICIHDRWNPLRPQRQLDPANFLIFVISQVCNGFKTLIDTSPSLWMGVSFPGIWPSQRNLHVLERFVEFVGRSAFWARASLFFAVSCCKSKLQRYFVNLSLLRAANTGNIEASIKIGLAHLYNEGSK